MRPLAAVLLVGCWHTPGYDVDAPSQRDWGDIQAAVEAHDAVVGNGSRCQRQARHVVVARLADEALRAACRVDPERVNGCHTTQHGACFPRRCSHVLVVKRGLPEAVERRVLIHEAMHWLDECTFGVEIPDNDHDDPAWLEAVRLAQCARGLRGDCGQ